MDNFIVSARKYRPVSFDTVFGQNHVTQILKHAIAANQLAQAFLFCGPRGVGKTTCARILAKTINCENHTENHEACNTCTSCVAFSQSTSYNIIELDAASNNSVEDIRSLVEQVRYPPHSGAKKVYIIDEVHMLSNQAFNAFLKTLEEPPAYAVFILATTEKHKIIPTILSRCQIFDFKRMSVRHIAMQLQHIAEKEDIQISQNALHLIAQKADGAMRDALSLFDMLVSFSPDRNISHQAIAQNLHILDCDYYFSITDHLLSQNLSAALLTYHEILQKGFDEHYFITGLTEHFRNLLLAKDPKTLSLLEISENIDKKKYTEQVVKADNFLLLSAINIAHEADLQFKQASNRRLHVEIALMKICHLKHAIVLDHLPDGEEKKNLTKKQNTTNTAIPTTLKATAENSSGDSRWSRTPKIVGDIRSVKAQIQSQPQQKIVLQTLSDTTAQQPTFPQPLDKTALDKAWKDYMQKMKAAEKRFEYIIMSEPYQLFDKQTVKITVTHPSLEEHVRKLKPELLIFLKKELQNNFIKITHKVNVVQEKKDYTPYTQEEKFETLKEQYPALLELTKKLGLQPE